MCKFMQGEMSRMEKIQQHGENRTYFDDISSALVAFAQA